MISTLWDSNSSLLQGSLVKSISCEILCEEAKTLKKISDKLQVEMSLIQEIVAEEKVTLS